jgi:precorrin-4/cobalt-precorrin-4 C11-methyltransferase
MISFVGAGPGAVDLITLRGARRLSSAEVVIWASSLVPEAILEHCRPEVEVHDSATMTLEDVLEVYASHSDGTAIVRLHSGDPSIYGAIAEQIDWCRANGRRFEVVPGVSSVSAAAASLQRELTQPGVSQTIVITRLPGRTAESMPRSERIAKLSAHGATMAVLLSGARPNELSAELLERDSSYSADTPAVVIARASWPDEVIVRTTVGELAKTMRDVGTTMTVLVLVGEVLSDAAVRRRSHLYSPGHATAYRLPSEPGSTRGRPSAKRRTPQRGTVRPAGEAGR